MPFSLKAVALVGPLGTLAPNLDPEKKADPEEANS